MKAALLASLILGLGLALPQPGQAQSYDRQGNSINIPLPKFLGNGDRQQQAQTPGNAGFCDDLRRQADSARYDADSARYPEDRYRAEQNLRDIDGQLARNCD